MLLRPPAKEPQEGSTVPWVSAPLRVHFDLGVAPALVLDFLPVSPADAAAPNVFLPLLLLSLLPLLLLLLASGGLCGRLSGLCMCSTLPQYGRPIR